MNQLKQEQIQQLSSNIVELNKSVGKLEQTKSKQINEISFYTEELSKSVNQLEQTKQEQINELSSDMVELNKSVNQLEQTKQEQINEISSNVDELTSQIESSFASINRLTVRVQVLNKITQSIIYTPEGSIAPSCTSTFLENPFAPSGYYNVESSNGSALRVYCDMTKDMW